MKTWPQAGPVQTCDLEIEMAWGGCKARVYRPSEGTLPLLIYYHGGGFMICDVETHDGVCRSIAGSAGVAVLSVDYRLAPEHPWPAGQDDVGEAIVWARAEAGALDIDAGQILLAGDSAGGNLAAVAALRLAEVAPVQGQVLIYPTTEGRDVGHASYRDWAEGYGLTAGDSAFFWDHYLSGQTPKEPHLMQRDDIGHAPPAFVATAEYDILRDEGEAYAGRLIAAGVPVFARRYLGANHNFLAFAGLIPACDDIYGDLARWIRSITGDRP
jgi:acetyl esterase